MGANDDIFSLEGKIIVVTGATRYYGYYFCGALAEAGGTVILTSRDKKKADDRAGDFTRRGLKVYGHSLDLGDDSSINDLVESVISTHKKIDVLVNNARDVPRMRHYEVDRRELDRVFTINCVGTMLLTRKVIEEMKKAGGGNIINISSIYGMGGQDISIYTDPDSAVNIHYPMEKGGLITYTKQLATVFGRDNIRANCFSLGGLRETAPDDPHFLEHYSKRVPLGRMEEPEDIKGAIVFLASDASRYMTGHNLVVDGGWTAW